MHDCDPIQIFARQVTVFFYLSLYLLFPNCDEHIEVLKDSIGDKLDGLKVLKILSIEDPVDTAYEGDNPKWNFLINDALASKKINIEIFTVSKSLLKHKDPKAQHFMLLKWGIFRSFFHLAQCTLFGAFYNNNNNMKCSYQIWILWIYTMDLLYKIQFYGMISYI